MRSIAHAAFGIAVTAIIARALDQPWLVGFALCLAFYAPLAGWRVAASLPLGDQIFYLLSAEKLTHGSLDATIDPRRFYELIGVDPQPVDAATHVAATPTGPRLVQ